MKSEIVLTISFSKRYAESKSTVNSNFKSMLLGTWKVAYEEWKREQGTPYTVNCGTIGVGFYRIYH